MQRRLSPVILMMLTWSSLSQIVLAASPPRNIVFILIDDLGWADLSCYGSTFHETPHLDALAAAGLRFTQAYAACPVCSPTRASILTGKHPVRVDITDWIPGNSVPPDTQHRFLQIDDQNQLPLEEVTLAEVLREAGYQTFFAGKWHLGGHGFLPTDQGFDVNFGGAEYGQPPGGYYAPWNNPWLRESRTGEYLTERLTEESLGFLRNRDPQRPFLLYLSHYDVHTPLHQAPRHFEKFRAKQATAGPAMESIAERRGQSTNRQQNARYASMIAAVDESVGQIVAVLREQQLMETTTIIFTSDNGGLCTLKNPGPTSNLPLRSGKGWLYEGGIRVPLLIASPEISKAGTVTDEPVLSTDYFPTILSLLNKPQPAGQTLDGQSFHAILKDAPLTQSRPLAWHYPHYHGSEWTPGAALRDGNWKVIEFYEFGDAELYNLAEDPGESRNLATVERAKLAEIQEKLRQWQLAMGARMPKPNAAWQPAGEPPH